MQELRDKLNKDLKIDCPIATFHSTGNAILRKQSDEKLNIVDSSKLYFVIQDYFKNSILKNESLVNNLIMFFASYFDAPYEGNDLNNFFNKIAKSNFATLRSDLNEFQRRVMDIRTKKAVTIQSEVIPILITISISSAPLSTASFVSKTLADVVMFPFGNPITVQMTTSSPTYSFAFFT